MTKKESKHIDFVFTMANIAAIRDAVSKKHGGRIVPEQPPRGEPVQPWRPIIFSAPRMGTP